MNYGVHVQGVRPKSSGRGYVVETNAGRFEAANVVIATGLYQKPKTPALSADVPPEIKQLHSDEYRNPQSLPDGAVLLVGSGQSGAQIAEELCQSGKKVYLSVSRAGRVPRRYRGKDANWWHERMGDYERTVDELPSPQGKFTSKPMISGKDGGHTLNLHQFIRDGVTLLGRIQGVRDHSILLAQDLKENLARADQFEADFVKKIDEFIVTNAIKAPEETLPVLTDGYEIQDVPELSLTDANIGTVIWATGYNFDFSLVQLPIFDGDGYPIQTEASPVIRACTSSACRGSTMQGLDCCLEWLRTLVALLRPLKKTQKSARLLAASLNKRQLELNMNLNLPVRSRS